MCTQPFAPDKTHCSLQAKPVLIALSSHTFQELSLTCYQFSFSFEKQQQQKTNSKPLYYTL